MIRRLEAPIARALSTNSVALSESTSARAIRAICGQPIRPNSMITVNSRDVDEPLGQGDAQAL
jgi:hypothetical protein